MLTCIYLILILWLSVQQGSQGAIATGCQRAGEGASPLHLLAGPTGGLRGVTLLLIFQASPFVLAWSGLAGERRSGAPLQQACRLCGSDTRLHGEFKQPSDSVPMKVTERARLR